MEFDNVAVLKVGMFVWFRGAGGVVVQVVERANPDKDPMAVAWFPTGAPSELLGSGQFAMLPVHQTREATGVRVIAGHSVPDGGEPVPFAERLARLGFGVKSS